VNRHDEEMEAEVERPTGRVLHADLHLLDRQIIDAEGRMVANVDDLEIDLDNDPPVVVAILTGPQAWGPRLPGLVGRLAVTAHRRLHEAEAPEPGRIPMSQVVDIDSAVHIAGTSPQEGFALWCRQQIIERIPGARHEAE
jgi:sporulation protein YlmC with PRC-barrel domain